MSEYYFYALPNKKTELNINVGYRLKYFINELYLIIIDSHLSTISNTSLCESHAYAYLFSTYLQCTIFWGGVLYKVYWIIPFLKNQYYRLEKVY